ncbi:MAG: hypothetical protein AAF587_03475 [Bacteroidota bacterium]
MKKTVISFLLLSLSTFVFVMGQGYNKGQLSISPTLAIRAPGAFLANLKKGSYTIPAVLYVDYGIHDMISVGAIGGLRYFQCERCSESDPGTYFSAGVRVNGHVLPILAKVADIELRNENLDIYLSLMGGRELNSSIKMIPRISAGLRYSVKPSVAVMVELGSGFLSMINVGATFRVL